MLSFKLDVSASSKPAFPICFLTTYVLCDSLWRRRGHSRWCPALIVKFLSKALLALFTPRGSLSVALAVYAWLRCVDDVFDEDSVAPWSKDRILYLKRKEQVMNAVRSGNRLVLDPEDLLLAYALYAMDCRGIDIRTELGDIWDSMEWVERRRLGRWIATNEELVHFTNLDDAGAVGLCVKVFGGDVGLFEKIAPAIKGVFMRIDMHTDFLEDIRRGVVNIPSESLSLFGIDIRRIEVCRLWAELRNVPGFLSWYDSQIKTLRKELSTVLTLLEVNSKTLLPSLFIWFLFKLRVHHNCKHMLDLAEARVQTNHPPQQE